MMNLSRQARHIHYSVLVLWFGVGGLVVSIIGNILTKDSFDFVYNWDSLEWILAFLIALVGILGSIIMNKAVCWVTPAKVMVVRSIEVVAAYILQLTVFSVPPHWTDLAGTVLVMLSVLAMGLEDCLMEALQWRWL